MIDHLLVNAFFRAVGPAMAGWRTRPLQVYLASGFRPKEPERRKVAQRFAEKYGMDADDSWVSDGLIYRLERR